MSDPLSSLKKTRRTPFRVQHNALNQLSSSPRNVSSSPLDPSDEELNNLADEVTTHMAFQRIKESRRGLPPLLNPTDRCPSSVSGVSSNDKCAKSPKTSDVSDFEMMSIMMSRITQLERRIHEQTIELTQKNRQIRILEEKILLMQKSRSIERTDTKNRELERKCEILQNQIYEMESFLADYGLIWVGQDVYEDIQEDVNPSAEAITASGQVTDRSVSIGTKKVWNPRASVSREFKLDYDLVLHQVKELNLLAGADEVKIEHSCDGITRLKRPESVPMTLFANGIVMFSGPFRPFSDPTTQQCLQDIMDGFFPSELESRFPEGVPFEITDKRDILFKDPLDQLPFHGEGQKLGGSRNTSKLVDLPVVQHPFSESTDELPGAKVTMDQFLSHLPSSVIRDGKVISVREAVKETLQGQEKSPQQCTLVETASVRELQARVESSRGRNQLTQSAKVATVRVRSEDGKHTYIVRMKFSENIGDLRSYIDAQRPTSLKDQYDIVANYPHRLLYDQCSIEESDLAPNGTVHLKKRKK